MRNTLLLLLLLPLPLIAQQYFQDLADEAGVRDWGPNYGVAIADYDKDGLEDIYVTRTEGPNRLFRNIGNLRFEDVAPSLGVDVEGYSTCAVWGDVDNDGWLDLYITNLSDNTLLLNQGDGTFLDVSQSAGITDPGMGWGTTFLDFDNDGRPDIYMVNDSYFSPQPNVLYRNLGSSGGIPTFEPLSGDTLVAGMEASYGTACADFNGDGLLDIFVANRNGALGNQLLINQTPGAGNWVKFHLRGNDSNYFGIGTQVTVESGTLICTDELAAGSGYASQNSPLLHFGLGQAPAIDRITVRWPSGLVETYEDLAANTTYTLHEGEGLVTSTQETSLQNSLKVFPNPTSERLFLKLSEPLASMRFRLLDTTGKTLLQAPTGTQTLNLEHLPPGTYFLEGVVGKQIVRKKIVVR